MTSKIIVFIAYALSLCALQAFADETVTLVGAGTATAFHADGSRFSAEDENDVRDRARLDAERDATVQCAEKAGHILRFANPDEHCFVTDTGTGAQIYCSARVSANCVK
jgi:hypothetical protein